MTARWMEDATWRWLVIVVVGAALVRFSSVIGAAMPVGDGGFVASAIDDIRDAGLGLPAVASYNGGEIPFAYPPLAFYLGAVLPWSPLTTLQWLPPILATATVVPTALVGRRLGGPAAGVASAAFLAVAPFAWFWLIQGGGLTRSLALLLGMTALAAATHRRGVVTGVLGGLTALTHPETAIFAAVAVGVYLVMERAWRPLAVAAVVSALVVAPWLILVVARHGLDPLVAAAGARSVNPIAAVLSISGDRPGALDLAAAVGLIGLAASGIRWLWIAAAVVALLLTTSLPTHLAPLLSIGTGATVAASRVARPVLVGAVVLLILGAAVTTGNPEPLGADDREAMTWIVAETPADARIAVLSNEIWSRADEAEWLPYLTDRVSVTTMQGREWLPDWRAIDARMRELRDCTDAACIDGWVDRHDVDYVVLADACCPALAAAIPVAPRFAAGTVQVFNVGGR